MTINRVTQHTVVSRVDIQHSYLVPTARIESNAGASENFFASRWMPENELMGFLTSGFLFGEQGTVTMPSPAYTGCHL